MSIEAVIFDVSKTLISEDGTVVAGMVDAIERLRSLAVRLIAADNDGPRSTVESRLRQRKLAFDAVFTHQEVGAKKGSPLWIQAICRRMGLRPNQLLYVGDSETDMRTALQGRVIYLSPSWAKPSHSYGIPVPAPGWIPAVVEHIFRRTHYWHWKLDDKDKLGRRVQAWALIDGNGARNPQIKSDLLSLLKKERDPKVGIMPLRDFLGLSLLAGLYNESVQEVADIWTISPSSTGSRDSPLSDTLKTVANSFHDRYMSDLLLRVAPAQHSRDAFRSGGAIGAIENQVQTARINRRYKSNLQSKIVVVLDDFITRGFTTDVSRTMLLQGGANNVIVFAIGKYNSQVYLLSEPQSSWDVFRDNTAVQQLSLFEKTPKGAHFGQVTKFGDYNELALDEFIDSYRAMETERW